MKIRTWLTTMPALLIAGMPAAEAHGWDELLCRIFRICGPGHGGGPVSVSEPEVIALFSTGLIVAGVLAVRRRLKK